jgi:hypothetical protein
LASFLIDQGLLVLANPIPGRDVVLDLNCKPPPEEEQPIIYSSNTSPESSSLFASRETHHTVGDHGEPSMVSSTEDNIPISLGLTFYNKRKCGSQDVQDGNQKFLRLGEVSQNSSNQQVELGGACKDGNRLLTIIHESNQLQSMRGSYENASIGKKGKGLLSSQRKNSHIPDSTHEEAPSKLFSVLNWQYVIVEPELEMLNPKCYPSVKIHDQKELFQHLNQFNLIENPSENFWIKKSHESFFFDSYRFSLHKDDSSYPNEISKTHRYYAIQEIMLRLYNKITPLQGSLRFVENIKNLSKLEVKTQRIYCIKKILKFSTVLFIMYLSIFGEHEGQWLKEEQIISFLKAIEKLLTGLAEDERFVPKSKDSIEGIWHDFLHLKRVLHGDARKNISIAWRTLEYWMETTKEVSTLNNSVLQARYHNKFWIHVIILKILFFSNHKKIYQLIENKKK